MEARTRHRMSSLCIHSSCIAPFIFLFKFCATFFSLFIIELYFTLYLYFFFLKEGP